MVQTVDVTDSAIPTFNPNWNGWQACANDSVNFWSTYNAVSYIWDFGDGNGSTLASPNHAYTADGTYNVFVTITNQCGNSAVGSMNADITSGNQANASFNDDVGNSCPGQPVTFMANNPGTTFEWDFGDTNNGTGTPATHTYADTGTYNVQLIVTNGCGNKDTNSYDVAIYIDSSNVPEAYVDIDGYWQQDTIYICDTTEFEFNNNSPWTDYYDWDFGDGTSYTVMNQSTEVHEYTGNGEYEMTLVARNSCGLTDTTAVLIILNDSIGPNAELEVMPMALCPGESAFFYDDSNNSSNSCTN